MPGPGRNLARLIEASPPVQDDRLTAVRKLAGEARALRAEIDDLEARLKQKKDALGQLVGAGHAVGQIVEAMKVARMMDFTLEAEGNYPAVRVALKGFYSAKWPEDERKGERAAAWMDKEGYGALVKTHFTVSFDRGERGKAQAFEKLLGRAAVHYHKVSNVHHSTLKAFIKEQDRLKKMPPLELLGAFVGQVAELSNVKE